MSPSELAVAFLMSAEASMANKQIWTSLAAGHIDARLPEQGEAHLVLMSLVQPEAIFEQLAKTLTSDEHERAARFHFDRDRSRFVVARGLLRQLLGRYLGMAGGAIRFSYGPFGKPYLPASPDRPKLEFSLSHSGDWALAGFARDQKIGVDLEQVRAMADYQELAQSNFAPPEVDALLGLPDNLQIDGFFACWTRKEAYAKALGLGLSLDLSTFVVSVKPGEDAEIVPASRVAGPLHVWALRPLEGYWAAAALETVSGQTTPPKVRLSTHSALAT